MAQIEIDLPQGQIDPPDGAMQFHVQRDPLGRKQNHVVWVLPQVPVRRIRGPQLKCECRQVYPVIFNLLPHDLKRLVKAQMKRFPGAEEIIVCGCRGQIIE